MTFKMNNRSWEIKEISQEKLKEISDNKTEEGTYFGLTCYDTQIIYLWEKLDKEAKKQTLIHELVHCYKGCYITLQEMNFTEDIICDICANSHDMIEEIVKNYFK